MTRFLVYTTPALGHTLPLVPGLLELQRRGHEVHVRAMPSLVDTLCGLGLAAKPVDPAVLEVPITDHLAATDAERLASGQVDLMARGRRNALTWSERSPRSGLTRCWSTRSRTARSRPPSGSACPGAWSCPRC